MVEGGGVGVGAEAEVYWCATENCEGSTHAQLHVICTRLRTGHLSMGIGDSLRRSKEALRNVDLRL